MKNNKFGITASFLGIVSLLMTIYAVSSLKMNDGLSETPELVTEFILLFTKTKTLSEPIIEPTLSSVNNTALLDETKRYYFMLISYVLIGIGTIFSLISFFKKEFSLFYAIGLFAAISTLSLLSVQVFIGYGISLFVITFVAKARKHITTA